MTGGNDHATGTGVASEASADEDDVRRNLYRYVTADNAVEYIALMRLFTGTLLADLSAAEAQEMLASTGMTLSVDDVVPLPAA